MSAMTPLDEMRAHAEAIVECYGCDTNAKVALTLARAVLAMLPVVERACDIHDDYTEAEVSQMPPSIQKTWQAVAAFRAANREGETKA